jgi:hypothetical protein
MIGIYLILVYGAGLTFFGLLILTFVPGFRLSLGNFILFEFGAILGMFAFANLLAWGLRHLLEYLFIRKVPDFFVYVMYFLIFLGTMATGMAFVWLRMRFAEYRERNAGTRN